MNNTIRYANQKERDEVNAAIHHKYFGSSDGDKVIDHIKDYLVIVVENYMSDGPGYVGPVYIMIWGEPGCVDVLTRYNGTLMVEERE